MKKKRHCALAFSLLTAGVLALAAPSCGFMPEDDEETVDKDGMKLVWSDEFDSGSVPSKSNWVREVWSKGKVNNEEQAYIDSKDTAYISDGTLKIKAYKKDGNWYSARLKTENASGSLSWKYGYFEAKLKMPKGNGVWPAFWMMPHDPTGKSGDGAYGTWPRSGELDIMEYSPGKTGDKLYATVHYGTHWKDDHRYTSLGDKYISGAADEWHIYGLRWTDEYVEAFIDNVSLGTKYYNDQKGNFATWPYDQKFYIILNLAMGGDLGGSIDPSLTEAVYEIDYVRVYQ